MTNSSKSNLIGGVSSVFVVAGGTCECSQGDTLSAIKVGKVVSTKFGKKPILTTSCTKMENPEIFGICKKLTKQKQKQEKSRGNPNWEKDGIVKCKGKYSPVPNKWQTPAITVQSNNEEIIAVYSTLRCSHGGAISIIDDGQGGMVDDFMEELLGNDIWKKFSNINYSFLRKRLLDNEVNRIINGEGTPYEKSELIIKAYENYLFKCNRLAFEKYGEARKIRKNLNQAEAKLSVALQSSAIDIKKIIREMDEKIANVNQVPSFWIPKEIRTVKLDRIAEGVSTSAEFLDFYYMVRTGGPMDFKSRPYSDEYDFSLWSRQWEKGMTADYLGNYSFGYYGKLYLPLPGAGLKVGAGAAQGFSDDDYVKWWDNVKNGNWGDNPGDAQMIQDGIDDYNKKFN